MQYVRVYQVIEFIKLLNTRMLKYISDFTYMYITTNAREGPEPNIRLKSTYGCSVAVFSVPMIVIKEKHYVIFEYYSSVANNT